jgi:hypothetical protein
MPSYRRLWKYTAASPTIYDVLLKHMDVSLCEVAVFWNVNAVETGRSKPNL